MRNKSVKENKIDELLPKRALTGIEISRYAINILKLLNFRGVFMLD